MTFHLRLRNASRMAFQHGSDVNGEELLIGIGIERAPGTAETFFTDNRMARMFATRHCEKFLGRDQPVEDAEGVVTLKPLWEWEFLYPVDNFERKQLDGDIEAVDGIVYICERRRDGEAVLGSKNALCCPVQTLR